VKTVKDETYSKNAAGLRIMSFEVSVVLAVLTFFNTCLLGIQTFAKYQSYWKGENCRYLMKTLC
jgi:hypothetical protein